MLLECAYRPHVVDAFLDRLVQSECLVRTGDQNHNLNTHHTHQLLPNKKPSEKIKYLFGIHYRSNTDRQRLTRNLRDVVIEKPRIRLQRVLGQRLNTRTRNQRRAGLIERNMTIRTDPADEQFDAAGRQDFTLEGVAFGFKVRRVAVENVDVCGINVDVLEEVVEHEEVVALRVVAGQTLK